METSGLLVLFREGTEMKTRKLMRFFFALTAAILMAASFAVSAEAAVKTPAKVKGLKITKATNTYISLSWSKAKNAKKYQVNYKLTTAKKWSVLNTKSKKATLKKLQADKQYVIKVRGINGKKKGSFSKSVKQKTYATPGTINAKSIFAEKRSRNKITLTWDKTANTSYYEIVAYQLNDDSYGSQQSIVNSYEIVHQTKPNTWYGYRIRAVNTKTGKFPAVYGAWTPMYYACTTSGDRVITGVKGASGTIDYTMTGTVPFRIGEDDALIPRGYVDLSDQYGPVFASDKLYCSRVYFPSDFETAEVANKTYDVGDYIDGEKIEKIVFENSFGEYGEGPDGYFTVTLYCENYSTHCYTF